MSKYPNGGERSNPSAPPRVITKPFRALKRGEGNTKGKNLAIKGK